MSLFSQIDYPKSAASKNSKNIKQTIPRELPTGFCQSTVDSRYLEVEGTL